MCVCLRMCVCVFKDVCVIKDVCAQQCVLQWGILSHLSVLDTVLLGHKIYTNTAEAIPSHGSLRYHRYRL